MAELVDAGSVRAIDVPHYPLEEPRRCHAQRPVDAIQVGLNPIDDVGDRPSTGAARLTSPTS